MRGKLLRVARTTNVLGISPFHFEIVSSLDSNGNWRMVRARARSYFTLRFGTISATRIIVTMLLKQRATARYSWNGVMCPFVSVHVASTMHRRYISRIVDRCHEYSSRHVVIWTSVQRDLQRKRQTRRAVKFARPTLRASSQPRLRNRLDRSVLLNPPFNRRVWMNICDVKYSSSI